MKYIDAENLKDIFPVKGYAFLDGTDEYGPYGDYRKYTLLLSKDGFKHVITFMVPEPDYKGVVSIGQVYKVVISHARRGAFFDLEPRSMKNIWVTTPGGVVKEAIREGLVKALAGKDPEPEIMQYAIDSFFSTSDLTRIVDPDKPIDLEMSAATVFMDVVTNPVDYRQRIFNGWMGRVDPVTTPSGKYVGQMFRFTKGAALNSGRIVPSKELFNRSMEKYLLFPENNRADRLLMARTVIARHEKLIKGEHPMSCHKEYDGKLYGIHLQTGILSHPLTYYDSICISRSAAKKLICVKKCRQVIIDSGEYEVIVHAGEYIHPEDPLMIGKKPVLANRIKTKALVKKVTKLDTMVGAVPAKKYVFEFEEHYPMTDGDKLSSRHSTKGVVRIIDDIDMPITKNGVRLEVMVHPRSFVGRRNLGAFREIMANKKVELARKKDPDAQLRTEHFSSDWSMEQLVREGFGEREAVFIGGKEAGEVFGGPLYWIRTDKHAIDACSAVGEIKPTDQHGLNPDTGRAGQRLGPDVACVMESKGLKRTLQSMVQESMEPAALEMMHKLMQCIE